MKEAKKPIVALAVPSQENLDSPLYMLDLLNFETLMADHKL